MARHRHQWAQPTFDENASLEWSVFVSEACQTCSKKRTRAATHVEIDAEKKRRRCENCGAPKKDHTSNLELRPACIALLAIKVSRMEAALQEMESFGDQIRELFSRMGKSDVYWRD